MRPRKFPSTDKGRRDDREFLARCREATADTIDELELSHVHKAVPPWKRAAIARARARVHGERHA